MTGALITLAVAVVLAGGFWLARDHWYCRFCHRWIRRDAGHPDRRVR